MLSMFEGYIWVTGAETRSVLKVELVKYFKATKKTWFTILYKIFIEDIPFRSSLFLFKHDSHQAVKKKTNTTQTKVHFSRRVFINLYVRAVVQILNAFSRLLLQSSARQASIAGCWVVTLSTPRHCSSTAG